MPIRRVVDLSMPLDERTPFYPGDPEPRICAATSSSTRPAGGRARRSAGTRSQSGTHCDAPYHFVPDGDRLDALPLERFVGPSVVVDATGLRPRSAIGWERLVPYAAGFGPGVIVLLRTGWDEHRARSGSTRSTSTRPRPARSTARASAPTSRSAPPAA